MKKIDFIIFLLLCVVLVIPVQGHAEALFVKLGTVLKPEHPTCQALTYFQQELRKISGNQIDLQIFPDAQLGAAPTILEGVQFGDIELGVVSSETLVSLAPLLSAVSLPYIFRDDGHRFRVLDGPVGGQLLDSLKQRNLIGLGFFDTGMRNLVTKPRPIKTPADLQNLKIGITRACPDNDGRNLPAQLTVSTFTAMGAVVESLCPEEVYQAFQSDRIDGWEGNEPDCVLLKIVETGAVHFTYSQYSAVPDVLVASKLWFDTLAPEIQQAIRKAARMTVRHQRELWTNVVQDAISQLEAAGMKFETVAREPFYEAVQPVYTKMDEELGPEFAEFVQAIMAVK